jgi:hypothetical protein
VLAIVPTSLQQETVEAVAAPTVTRALRPTREEVVTAIEAEALEKGWPCSHKTALKFFGLFGRAIGEIRRYYGPYHLTNKEINDLHPLLEVLVPDEVTVPAEGSVHDLLHKHFLRGDEFAIVHTKAGERLEYCAIAIELTQITTN